MSQQITPGLTFAAGTYGYADLNTFLTSATILPAVITDQAAVSGTLAGSDKVLGLQGSGLVGATINALIAAFQALVGNPTSDSTIGMHSLGSAAHTAAAGNDVRLAATLGASVGGLRAIGASGQAQNDFAAGPKNLIFPSVNIGTNPSSPVAINWDSSDVFYGTFSDSTNRTITFSNLRDGRVIVLLLNLTGYTGTITWPSLTGTPTVSAARMLYTFTHSFFTANPVVTSHQI